LKQKKQNILKLHRTFCSSNHDTENKCWDIDFLRNFR
jgi:hypothetical protein